jgi:hypothetical protein
LPLEFDAESGRLNSSTPTSAMETGELDDISFLASTAEKALPTLPWPRL